MKFDEKYGNVLGKPRLIVGCSATDGGGGEHVTRYYEHLLTIYLYLQQSVTDH